MVWKHLFIAAVLRRQIPETLSRTGKKQFAFQGWPGLMGLHQFIHLQGTGVAGRLPFADVLVKVVGVEWAEQAAARPCLQSPRPVSYTHLTLPTILLV